MSGVVEVLLPYEQWFIPFRHRTKQREVLWGPHRIEVRTIAPREAPIAFRTAPVDAHHEDCAPGRVVRSFEGRFWWPLLDAHGPASAAGFVLGAMKGIPRVLTVLRCPLNFPLHGADRRPSLDDLLNEFPKCRLVSSTFDAQANEVNHGAGAIVFCDDKVLVAAGQPIYYAVERFKATASEIIAGPSSLDPAPDFGYRLPGPDLFLRSSAAEKGLAFGHEELAGLRARLTERGKRARQLSRIHGYLQRYDDDGSSTCARALAERLWKGVASGSGWDWPWLSRYLPSLAEAGERGADIRTLHHRRVLEELVALELDTRSLAQEKIDAREILRRLDEIVHLSREDDDALSDLASLVERPSRRRLSGGNP